MTGNIIPFNLCLCDIVGQCCITFKTVLFFGIMFSLTQEESDSGDDNQQHLLVDNTEKKHQEKLRQLRSERQTLAKKKAGERMSMK